MIAIAMIFFFLMVLAWLVTPTSSVKAEAPAPSMPLVVSDATA